MTKFKTFIAFYMNPKNFRASGATILKGNKK